MAPLRNFPITPDRRIACRRSQLSTELHSRAIIASESAKIQRGSSPPMNTIRPCGCKGVRTCLQCEQDYNIAKASLQKQLQKLQPLSFCVACHLLFPGWDTDAVSAAHPGHNGDIGQPFPGVLVQEQFLTAGEADAVMETLDTELPWTNSQSGRRKQNFGPKTNFKKRRLHCGNFNGFPKGTEFIQQRLRQVEQLHDFQTVEQCSLEYEPSKGACIEPHVDDCWVWGERVVTVNCLGDAVLTLRPLPSDTPPSKYNLDQVAAYDDRLLLPLATEEQLAAFDERVIRIPMPNRSLIVLFGPPRYQYEHAVLREDVLKRRVCIAYREFTPEYLRDGADAITDAAAVLRQARNFWS